LSAPERNLTAVRHGIDAEMRRARFGHRGGVVWFTGLSGSGKSTLATALEVRLFEAGMHPVLLDGDNLRHGLNADLGFSPEDREENIRRAGAVAALFAEAGMIVIASFISPYAADRAQARAATKDPFLEVHLDVDVSVCQTRDPKGLYAKAIRGEIPEFTGVSAPYEAPETPELRLDTNALGIEACVDRLEALVRERLTSAA